MRNLMVACAVTLVMFSSAPSSAVAARGRTGGEVEVTPEGPRLVADVYVADGPYVGRGQPCRWTLIAAVLAAGVDRVQLEKRIGGVLHRRYLRDCAGQTVEVWVPQVTGRVLGNPARDRVERLVQPPVLVTAPPNGSTYVKLGTWFRTSASWEPRVAHAVVENAAWGRVWSTVTATPIKLVFDPDTDDILTSGTEPAVCFEAGEVFVEGYGDDRVTACMYTYLHSSRMAANQEFFHTRLSIVWQVTWEDSLGRSGDFGTLTTSQDSTMVVKEIHAVVVG